MSENNWNLEPSLESVVQVQIKPQYELFINGKWQAVVARKYAAIHFCSLRGHALA